MLKIWHLTTSSQQHLTYDLLPHYFQPWRPDLQHFATLNSAVNVQTFIQISLDILQCNEFIQGKCFPQNAMICSRLTFMISVSRTLNAKHRAFELRGGVFKVCKRTHTALAQISASKTPNRTESQLPCSSTTKQCAQTQSITALDDRKVIFGILELCCTQGHISQLGCPNQNVIGLKDDPIWGAMAYLKKKLDAISKQALFTLESIFCGPHFLHSGKNEESVKLEGEILSVAVRRYVGITSWLLTQQLYLSPSAT